MGGSNRIVILAIFGLAIASFGTGAYLVAFSDYKSPPEQTAQRYNQATDKAAGQRTRQVDPEFEGRNKAVNPEAPCQQGRDDRRSDLCAQWKAADAAQESADWAGRTFWLGLVGTVIGALTLMAAAFAAWYAKEAARHTKTSADEAGRAATASEEAVALSRTVSSADLRAWVSIEIELQRIHRSPSGISVTIKAAIKNNGKTPAQSVGVSIVPYLAPSIRTGFGEPPDTTLRKSPMPALMPGMEKDQSYGFTIISDDIERETSKSIKGGCLPIICFDACVAYHTIFDADESPPRISSVRFLGVPPQGVPEDRAKMARWLLDGPIGIRNIIFRQDRSAPIEMS